MQQTYSESYRIIITYTIFNLVHHADAKKQTIFNSSPRILWCTRMVFYSIAQEILLLEAWLGVSEFVLNIILGFIFSITGFLFRIFIRPF